MEIYETWIMREELKSALRYPFIGIDKIQNNYSQAFQDLFVLSMMKGARNKTYLEIGAFHPYIINNTYLLHHEFDWNGISIEIDGNHMASWQKERPECQFLVGDALTLDYFSLLNHFFTSSVSKKQPQEFLLNGSSIHQSEINRIDYLQIDVDPGMNSLSALKKLVTTNYRFSIITFETDVYTGDYRPQEESRKLLFSLGYKLVGPNILVYCESISKSPIPFEDWWIDPLAIDETMFSYYLENIRDVTYPQDLIFSL